MASATNAATSVPDLHQMLERLEGVDMLAANSSAFPPAGGDGVGASADSMASSFSANLSAASDDDGTADGSGGGGAATLDAAPVSITIRGPTARRMLNFSHFAGVTAGGAEEEDAAPVGFHRVYGSIAGVIILVNIIFIVQTGACSRVPASEAERYQ